jgi:hypothetical protein
MRFLKQSLPVAVILALLLTAGLAMAADAPTSSPSHRQADIELTQELYWPEAGVTIMHPEDWQLVNDPNFDFVLLGTQTENDLAYVTMQSGGLGGDSVLDIMTSFDGVTEGSVSEFEAGDVTAYRFTDETENGTIVFIGFTPDDSTLFLLGMFASGDLWSEWEGIYEAVIDEMAIDAIDLDNETLNAQMQTNYEETGMLMVGEPDAPVQIYEFLDFACPHCVDFHYSLNRLVQDYVETGDANLAFGLLTFVGGPLSENASAIQVCGAQLGVGWDVHNIIFESYREQGGAQTGFAAETLLDAVAAAELDVDMATFNACFAESTGLEDFLALSQADATEYGVSGTPSMLYATAEEDFSFMMSGQGEPITRTNLFFTYEYLDSLLAEAESSAE